MNILSEKIEYATSKSVTDLYAMVGVYAIGLQSPDDLESTLFQKKGISVNDLIEYGKNYYASIAVKVRTVLCEHQELVDIALDSSLIGTIIAYICSALEITHQDNPPMAVVALATLIAKMGLREFCKST